MRRPTFSLVALLVLFSSSGAHCLHPYPSLFGPRAPQAPRLLPVGATLEQVIDVVNNNSARIQSYSTTDARITVAGMPGLRAEITIERPRRFRLRAGTTLTGPEVDLGSNDELFWAWVRHNQPRALYFCRHDQYSPSAAQEVMPIEPRWLIDALGLMSFDPGAEHRGPFPRRPGGNLEIRSTEIRSTGPAGLGGAGLGGRQTKITVIDPSRGWVLEQHVYSAAGELLASTTASEYRYDRSIGVSLPGRVSIHMPLARLSLNIDLGNFSINQLSGDPAQLWAKPTYVGFPEIDLCQPNRYLPPTSPPVQGYLPQQSVPMEGRYQSLPYEYEQRRYGVRPIRY